MMRVALRGLAGRKLRSLLTAIAIVLGVAMMSGTYVLTDTIDRAFDTIFSESYAGTDAVITGAESDISFQGTTAETPPVRADLLERVRSVEGVESAVGSIADESATKILDQEGDAVETGGAPTFGFGIDAAQTRFNPLQLNAGRWPSESNEVVLDAGTAKEEDYSVGDTVSISTLKPARPFEIVGIAQYGDVESLGGATFAVFDIPTAQQLLEREGELDAIQIAAAAGVTPEQLVQNLRAELPQEVTVRTGQGQADEDSSEISAFTSIIRYFLLTFAVVALFVGAFVIFNTLSITVAQRTREFATVRTIGGSRRQVLLAVMIEALAVGLLASLIGLFLGLGLAAGLRELFAALNLDLPATGLVFATRTIVVSLLVGVFVTLFAGLAPAVRATRVPPIAAVREGAELPRGRFARVWPWVAAVITALGVLLLGYALFAGDIDVAQRLLSIAFGVLSLFIGVALLSPRLVRPLARVVGWPATRVGGVAGRLAQGNSMRNPGRTAATAAALMIGIALVTFVSVLAQGMRTSNSDAIKRQIRADFVITSQDGYTPFVAGIGDAARETDGAEVVTDVRTDLAEVAGSDRYVTGIDPQNITAGYRFEWKDGSDAVLGQLGRTGAIVASDFAEDKSLAVGDSFALRTAGGQTTQLVVKGVYTPPPFYPLLGSVSGGDVDLRLALRAEAQPVHVRELPGRADGGVAAGARGRGGAVPGRARADAGGVDREGGSGDPAVPEPAVRAACAVGDRLDLRDREDPRALDLRADTRTRDAAGGRDDAPPGAPDGAARERDHGADRARAGAAARRLPRRADDPGARPVQRPVRGADGAARRARGRRGRRRDAGGDPAGAPRRAAERSAGAPVRIGSRWGQAGA